MKTEWEVVNDGWWNIDFGPSCPAKDKPDENIGWYVEGPGRTIGQNEAPEGGIFSGELSRKEAEMLVQSLNDGDGAPEREYVCYLKR